MKTSITDLLGIQYPMLQGGMAWVANASLASAVSNAGGLGIIAAGNAPADWLRGEIRAAKTMTDKPIGVNIMLLSPFADEIAQVVIDENVEVLTAGAGNPTKFMPGWLAAGIKVIPVVPSVAMAKLAERAGACAVIAEGGEAGGHVGDLTTMVLVPQIVDTVDLPVIAAGGIADGRGIAAAYMLGAVGVQVGTRFLVANECTISDTYKERVIKAKDRDTVATGHRLGHPVRSLKNPFSRNFTKLEYDSSVTNEELEGAGVGALRKAVIEGDWQNGCFMAGQSAAMVTREQSCKEIIEEMFAEAGIVLSGARRYLTHVTGIEGNRLVETATL